MTEDVKGEATSPAPNPAPDETRADGASDVSDVSDEKSEARAEPASAPDAAIASPSAAVSPAPSADAKRDWRRWAFALVPAVAIFELLAHVKQTQSVVSEADWRAAQAAVAQMAHGDDLVIFAPGWADPLGREYFGDALASIPREARGDETRFTRAIEVSIRGKHRPELAGWPREGERQVGAITITTFKNPAPAKVIDDLFDHASPSGMSVQRIDGGHEQDCPWTQAAPQTGGLGFGPTVPGNRFACAGGNFVGISIIQALDNTPRRCFFAPPGGGSSVLRARFSNVTFGQALHGHVGISQFAERDLTGAPVALVWKVGDKTLGRIVHTDGDGWKGFEVSTSELAGQKGELVAEITASNGKYRFYCFEADTR